MGMDSASVGHTHMHTHMHTHSPSHIHQGFAGLGSASVRHGHMTVSTENASTPKSTKSRNSNSLVQTQNKPKSQFEFVLRDTEKLEFLDLVDFGGSNFGAHCHTHTHIITHIRSPIHQWVTGLDCASVGHRHTHAHSCTHTYTHTHIIGSREWTLRLWDIQTYTHSYTHLLFLTHTSLGHGTGPCVCGTWTHTQSHI